MKKMLLLVFALVLISWGQASADVFDFTFTGLNISASGTLNADPNGDGTYTATSGSGTANGVAMTLLLNPNGTANAYSPTGYFYYDNQLFPPVDPLIDSAGLLFTATSSPYYGTSGTTEINLYGNGAALYTYYENTGYNENGTFTLTGDSEDPGTNAVPEPVSLLFLGFGLVGIVGAKRKLKG